MVAITSPDICPNRSKWNIWFIISSYSRLVVSPFHKSPEDPNPNRRQPASCTGVASETLRRLEVGGRMNPMAGQWMVKKWMVNHNENTYQIA